VTGEANRVYRNNGDDTFTLIWSSAETDKSSSVAWGDCDGDEAVDHVAGNTGNEPVRVYRNTGGGAFALAWTSPENENTQSVQWGDYDGDGDLDLVVANNSQFNRVYDNDGTCGFTLNWTSIETEFSEHVDWGDYDNDGDLDQLVSNSLNQKNRVYKNNSDHANILPTTPGIINEPDVQTYDTYTNVTLEWAAGTDAETPGNLLTYWEPRAGPVMCIAGTSPTMAPHLWAMDSGMLEERNLTISCWLRGSITGPYEPLTRRSNAARGALRIHLM